MTCKFKNKDIDVSFKPDNCFQSFRKDGYCGGRLWQIPVLALLSWHNCRIICCSCCSWCHVFFQCLVIVNPCCLKSKIVTFNVVFLHYCHCVFLGFTMVRTINAVLHKYFYILIIQFCHCNLRC